MVGGEKEKEKKHGWQTLGSISERSVGSRIIEFIQEKHWAIAEWFSRFFVLVVGFYLIGKT